MRTISIRNPLQKWRAQSSLVCVSVPTTTYRHHHIQAPPHNHHHTVQVAQVQLEHLHHWLEGKHHQLKLLKLIRGTRHQHPLDQVGAGCSKNMQLAHGHNLHVSAHVQVACTCCILLQLAPMDAGGGQLLESPSLSLTCFSSSLWPSR